MTIRPLTTTRQIFIRARLDDSFRLRDGTFTIRGPTADSRDITRGERRGTSPAHRFSVRSRRSVRRERMRTIGVAVGVLALTALTAAPLFAQEHAQNGG